VLAPAARAGVAPDALFAANFEALPYCSSIGTPGCPGFTMEIPLALAAGEQAAYCYYFRTPNSGTLGVGRFSSRFDAITAHIIVYTTIDQTTGAIADRQAPGTLSATGCGFSTGGNNTVAHRIYSAHAESEQLRMPDSDGAGNPLAVELPANAAGFIEIYVVNPSLNPINTRVWFGANGLAAGASYTKTATYMTYNANISVPPFTTNSATAAYACSVPPAVKFWWLSTHTHRYAVSATLSNGASTLLSTTNWESPAIQTYAAPDFYAFADMQKLTYQCVYDNPTARTVTAGDDYVDDENCVGIGYFFPADAPKLCYNEILLPPPY
jgi:hypothetical protein